MRPLTVGELLDASFGAVRRNFRTLALCTLVVIAPVSVLSTLVTAATSDNAFDLGRAAVVDEDDLGAFLAGSLISALLTVVGATLATAACLRAVAGDVLGDRLGPGDSLRFAAARLGPLLWAALLYGLAVAGGLLLVIVGAIWLWVLFCLFTPALLFEDRRGREALSRSQQLVSGHWWRTFGALAVMYLIVSVVGSVLGGVFGGMVLADSESEALNAAVLTAVNVVAYAISLPLTAALTVYIYFDLRLRKEGVDVQRLAAEIGSGDTVPASSETVAGLPGDPGGFLPPRPPQV